MLIKEQPGKEREEMVGRERDPEILRAQAQELLKKAKKIEEKI